MRRVWLVVALLGVLAVTGADVDAQEDQVEVTVVEVGWWSSSPLALAQPEGGFEVATSPTGEPTAVAALRLSIALSSVSTMPIRLTEVGGVSEFGVLKVCATSDAWTAENPGALADAPTPDCTTAATALTHTLDGVWIGDVAALAPDGGEVSLTIVPEYHPPVPIGPGMDVVISKAELAATGSSASPDTTIPTDTTVPVDPGDDVVFPTEPGSSFGVPPVGDLDLDPAELATTTTSAPPLSPDEFALDPLADEGRPPKPWVRLVALVPLCAVFGVASARVRRIALSRGFLAT